MKTTATLVALCAVLTACAASPAMQEQRELLAADVRDSAAVAARLAPEGSRPYFVVLEPMLDAFVAGDQQFGYHEAFVALDALEPGVRKALATRGMKAEQIESTVLLQRILLRRIQAQVIRDR